MPRVYKRRRKRTYRKKSIDAKQSKAITVLKKKVRALEAPIELKYQYQYHDIDNISSVVQPFTLNLIRPWASDATNPNESRLFQREGDTVSMKNLYVRGKLSLPYVEDSIDRETATRVRMIYVYYPDEPPGSNIPDILEDTLVSAGLSIVDCFYKRNSKLKYKILKDVIINLEQNYYNYANTPSTPVINSFSGLTSTKPNQVTINHKLDLSKLPAMGKALWKDNGAVPALGQICLFLMADNQNLDAEFVGQSQLTWHDQ